MRERDHDLISPRCTLKKVDDRWPDVEVQYSCGPCGGGVELLVGAGGEEEQFEEANEDDKAAVCGDVVELEDAEEDCAAGNAAPDPGAPSAEDIENHRIDHPPYICWCEHCVRGRGVGDQHRAGAAGSIPIRSFDYLLVTTKAIRRRDELTTADGDVLLKILVVKDSFSTCIMAHVVRAKGADTDGYVAEKLRRDVLWLGYSRIIMRSDNEPAIVKLPNEALTVCKVDLMQVGEPHPAPYDSKGNGSIENAIKLVQGMLRTTKDCLEARIQRRIPTDHPVMAWLTRHESWLLTIKARGSDGRTAYERN